MTSSGITTIFYDTVGTMLDWRTSLIDQGLAFGKERELVADWPELATAWRKALQAAMKRIETELGRWKNLDQLQRETLDKVLSGFELDHLSLADRDMIASFWRRLHPWPDVIPGLSRLKGKCILAPFTNANASLATDLVKFSGLPADRLFTADLSQHYKPSADLYAGALRLSNTRAENILLVAAHNYDLKAARAAGIKTAFLSRPTEYGVSQDTDLEPEDDWDLVVGSATELADRVEEWTGKR